MADDAPPPEQPRVEPEIIPPDHRRDQSDFRRSPSRPMFTPGYGSTQRLYVGRVGPLGMALLLLALIVIVVLIAIAVLGAFLLWIPVLAFLAIAAAVFRLLRR